MKPLTHLTITPVDSCPSTGAKIRLNIGNVCETQYDDESIFFVWAGKETLICWDEAYFKTLSAYAAGTKMGKEANATVYRVDKDQFDSLMKLTLHH